VKKQKFALIILATFCIVISIMHVSAVLFRAQLETAGFKEPFWYSVFTIIFSLLLALWIFRIFKKD